MQNSQIFDFCNRYGVAVRINWSYNVQCGGRREARMPEFCGFVGCLSYRVLSAVSFHPLADLIGHTSVEFDNLDPGACRDGDLLGIGTAAAGAGRACAGAARALVGVVEARALELDAACAEHLFGCAAAGGAGDLWAFRHAVLDLENLAASRAAIIITCHVVSAFLPGRGRRAQDPTPRCAFSLSRG